MDIPNINDLFDMEHTIAVNLFHNCDHAWDALSYIGIFIEEYEKKLSLTEFYSPYDRVYISKSAKVADSAHITGPCIISHGAEVRHSAYIRGNVIIGQNSVVGNSTELKNCVLFDRVEVPHYNYIGDSILGYHAHLGAGAVTSNVKSDKTNITINSIDTGRRKLGALIGDYVEIGCGAVLNPGCIIGRRTTVYPQSSVRGIIPSDRIYKDASRIVKKSYGEMSRG